MSVNRPAVPRIFAHRGGALLAPENTRTAFDKALHYQSDVLETDVRISADRQIIVTHDATVERTTNGRGKVCELSLRQLKKLDAGYHSRDPEGRTFRGRGITLLTLDELFQSYPATAVNIDIKDNNPLAAQLVAESILRHERTADVLVCSFNKQVLQYFRELAPMVRTAAAQHEVAQLLLRLLPLPGGGKHFDFNAVQIPTAYRKVPLTGSRLIRLVQQHDKELCYWTVNDSGVMRRLLSRGVDGIITDRPDAALQVFREFGYKSGSG